uniref:MFS transporter n=1 Tax=Agrobacterium albertimagni TaxID=147266 RepID=A0A7C1T8W0_9HYPH
MPAAIYAFSLCAFALGFVEFVVIGLSPSMALDLGLPAADLGATVTAYALGVAIGAPFLTALTSGWSRKTLLTVAMLVFVAGNVVIAMSSDLGLILGARFATGLMHGVFLAVASSVAAALVPANRSASAIAFVFGGLTIALVTGVPAGTYLGAVWSWRAVFISVSVCAIAAVVGLWLLTPAGTGDKSKGTPNAGLKGLLNPALIGAAGITVLANGGAFTLYTYVTPLLTDVTGLEIGVISTIFLLYGLAAAVGNVAGGMFSDRVGSRVASASVLGLLTAVLLGIAVLSSYAIPTAVMILVLGFAMFAAVPILQSRMLGIAASQSSDLSAAASGMNIAAFNLGITAGSLVGHGVISQFGIAMTPLAGAIGTAVGFILILAARPAYGLAR